MAKRNTLQDVWKYIDKRGENDCWEWTGVLNTGGGYGYIGISGKCYVAHRVVYYLMNPNTIELNAPENKTEKKFILHKCDNRKCCNPNHLFIGNYLDNIRDAKEKGRLRSDAPKGINHKLAKLTMEQVREIRKLSKEQKLSNEKLRKMFFVSNEAIRRIVNNISYKE